MPEKTDTQTPDTTAAGAAKSDAPITSTSPASVDELAAARTRITVLEEQLAAADRDRVDLMRHLDERRPRPVYPELLSTLVDLWRATGDARYLDAAKTQGEALLTEIAPTAPSQG